MLIKKLEITALRNLQSVSLDDLSSINIIFGSNGSGKTSVLESIHMLSSARSFRGTKIKPIINTESDYCICFGLVSLDGIGKDFQPVGVQRYRSASIPSSIKVSGNIVRSASVLAESLPLQVICSDTFKLLEGSPSVRRQYLDWGVFHVEHRFHSAWKKLQRCLKQRNSLLRRDRIDTAQMEIWTAEFIGLSEEVDRYRSAYFNLLVPVFDGLIKKLVGLEGVELKYYRGWDADTNLGALFLTNEAKEREQKYTSMGSHRADIRFKYLSANAADTLSRGQQKLLICAFRIAQGFLLSSLMNKSCVYLVDDLPAELDKEHRVILCSLLEELKCQVFITCVDYKDVVDCWSDSAKIKMFHVEHGSVNAVSS